MSNKYNEQDIIGGNMSYIESRDRFLSQFTPNVPERQFYEACFRLLEALSPPITYYYGLAVIVMLQYSVITLVNRYTFGHDPVGMGSVEDCANVVAVMFAEINADPIWWKARFPADSFSSEVRLAVRHLMAQLKQLDFVMNVESYLDP